MQPVTPRLVGVTVAKEGPVLHWGLERSTVDDPVCSTLYEEHGELVERPWFNGSELKDGLTNVLYSSAAEFQNRVALQ